MPSINQRSGCKNPWIIPELWKDEIVYVVGGGKSIEDLDLDRLKNRNVISVHYSIRKLGNVASIWFSGDARAYWELKEELNSFSGLKISLNIYTDKNPSIHKEPGILIVNMKKGKGLSSLSDRSRLFYNGSAGGAAIDLAAKLGAKTIILLGFDMNESEPGLSPRANRDQVLHWINDLSIWKKILYGCRKHGIQIWNCTPNSKLPVIPQLNMEDWFHG